jgi:2-(3-amino-3-carboxypropyl)histidine synthase
MCSYVGDGRFHLESIMIANPTVPAFRYDPYSKKFTRETYEHTEMKTVRGDAVRAARKGLSEKGAGSWAVLLGTLGRQGSLSVLRVSSSVESLPDRADLQSITSALPTEDPPLLILLSELSPAKLALFSPEVISTFVQTSCPRLSIDWGYAFNRPLLSPYEASVALGRIRGWGGLSLNGGEQKGQGDYPMDFYSVSLTEVILTEAIWVRVRDRRLITRTILLARGRRVTGRKHCEGLPDWLRSAHP